jgi:hypothetical protein
MIFISSVHATGVDTSNRSPRESPARRTEGASQVSIFALREGSTWRDVLGHVRVSLLYKLHR